MMNETSYELLEKEIKDQIAFMRTLERGSKEYMEANTQLVALIKARVDESKIRSDKEERETKYKIVIEEKEKELVEMRKDRHQKLWLSLLELFGPLVAYGIWLMWGFKFEETGAFTSNVFRGLISRFKPSK